MENFSKLAELEISDCEGYVIKPKKPVESKKTSVSGKEANDKGSDEKGEEDEDEAEEEDVQVEEMEEGEDGREDLSISGKTHVQSKMHLWG